jgi:hypothetical protein
MQRNKLTNQLTKFMKQSPSWVANRSSGNQKIPRILWNAKVHYRLQNSPPYIPILSHMSLVDVPHPTSWRLIVILSYHLYLDLPSVLFASVFPTETLYAPPIASYTLQAPTIWLFLIWYPNTDHSAPHYVAFFIPKLEEQPQIWREAANVWISSGGCPTKGVSPARGLDDIPTAPHRETLSCHETLTDARICEVQCDFERCS